MFLDYKPIGAILPKIINNNNLLYEPLNQWE